MKLGLFGGTFDPIHVGHLVVAEETRVQLQLDEVCFVTAGKPRLKRREITEVRHRIAMVEAATRDKSYFTRSEIEVKRDGPTYTVDTLEMFIKEYGSSVELYLLVGLDALAQLNHWRKPERVIDLCRVVGIGRPGVQEVDLESVCKGLSEKTIIVDTPMVQLSSTDIRDRVKKNQTIKHMVPLRVEEYIYSMGLYGDST